MPAPTPGIIDSEELLAIAESGKWDNEKYTVEQRRKVVAFVMATRPDVSNIAMARWFKISDTAIRKDKDWIRTKASEEITKDDIGLVIVDIRRSFERFMTEVGESAKKAQKGTNTYLMHQKLMMDYQLKVVEALQSLGYYPKNMGNLTKKVYVFKSHVNTKTGDVNTLPVEGKDGQPPMIDAEFIDHPQLPPAQLSPKEQKEKEEDAALREQFAKDFSDIGNLVEEKTAQTEGS